MRLRNEKVFSVCVLVQARVYASKYKTLLKLWSIWQTFTKFWYRRYVVTNNVKGELINVLQSVLQDAGRRNFWVRRNKH